MKQMSLRRYRIFGFVFTFLCSLPAFGLSLDGTDWKLSYRSQQEGGEWKTVAAEVPGDVIIDLERAGVIPDPMVGTNVFGLFWTERCEWKYEKTFPRIALKDGERAELRFKGVDTRAEYWLNGERLGASENMFVPVVFDITGRMRDRNELAVIIRSSLRDPEDLAGSMGRTRIGGPDVEGIRKAMHMFGWDIMPRLVSAGIWQSVSLEAIPPVRFKAVRWITYDVDAKNRTAKVFTDCDIVAPWNLLHRTKLRISLLDGSRIVARLERPLRHLQNRDELNMTEVDFWWPRDAGEPKLYDAVAEVIGECGEVLAADRRKVGLRTIRLERADWHSEADPGTFRFVVNGEPIYMHGCDWSPLDALHSRDRLHLRKACEMLVDLNCNMIRIWGGGVYGSDELYDFCDRNGILVWQDFMMGNYSPEQNDGFAAAVYEEARSQAIRLRGHPSLAIWCGNNETDQTVNGWWGNFGVDLEKDRISREVLPRVLRDFDPFTPYIPSSPWLTPDVVAGKAKLSQNHLWGPRAEWFKGDFWCNNTPTFVSEMGCHGCPNQDSLKRMMSSEGLYPWPAVTNKFVFGDDWNCKATTAYPEQGHGVHGDRRNSLMVHQVKTMFGSVPDDLARFSEQSQIYQAQALKTWIELFRARKGRTWGLLWWNLRDGWPIISDGIVDYWFGRKKAYSTIREAQRTQLVCVVDDPQPKAVAVNDALKTVRGRVRITDKESKRVVLDRLFEVPPNGKTDLGMLKLSGKGAVSIDYEIDGKPFKNYFIYGEPPFDFEKVREWME